LRYSSPALHLISSPELRSPSMEAILRKCDGPRPPVNVRRQAIVQTRKPATRSKARVQACLRRTALMLVRTIQGGPLPSMSR
jgi:hypothetical protein